MFVCISHQLNIVLCESFGLHCASYNVLTVKLLFAGQRAKDHVEDSLAACLRATIDVTVLKL